MKEDKIKKLYNIFNRPKKVRSFVSKQYDTTRSAMEAQISRSFYAHAEGHAHKQSVCSPNDFSQSTKTGGIAGSRIVQTESIGPQSYIRSVKGDDNAILV